VSLISAKYFVRASLVQISIFGLSIKAGTGFGDLWEVAVPHDLSLGIGLLQFLEEVPEGGFLLGSAGVGIFAVLIHSSYIAYTDSMSVIVGYMCACILLRSSRVDGTVLIDDPVITTLCPSFGSVPPVDILDRHLPTDLGTGAMDYNPLNILHFNHE